MSSYFYAMKMSLLIFPILALVITIPYMIIQYKKYGSILIFKTAIIYSFILYLLAIYLLVILPLPPIEEVSHYTTPYIQLQPFYVFMHLSHYTSFTIYDISTYSSLLGNTYFYQVIYNILITLPFGIYLRYYFKCNFKKTVFLTFLLSFFFEFTQLSGLYGIYPRPYRIFDVDDFIANTVGGVIGYLLAPLVCFFLPHREEMDGKAYQKGRNISFPRRTLAFFIDLVMLTLMIILCYFCFQNTFLNNYLNGQVFLCITIYFILIPILYKGITIGRFLVNIQVVSTNELPAKWYQYLIREYSFFLLYIFSIPLLKKEYETSLSSPLKYVFLFATFLILILLFLTIFKREHFCIHEKISHTKYINLTNQFNKEEKFINQKKRNLKEEE